MEILLYWITNTFCYLLIKTTQYTHTGPGGYTGQKGQTMWIITTITDGKKAYFKGSVIPGIPHYTLKENEAMKFKTKSEANYYNKKFAKGTVEKGVTAWKK